MNGYPSNPNLCDHGLNRQACLKCFHQSAAAPKPAKPDPITRNVPTSAQGIIQAVKSGPRATSPVFHPPTLAEPSNGQATTIASPNPIAPQPGRAPVAQVTEQGLAGAPNAAPQRVYEPFSYQNQPEAHTYDQDGLWQPPKRKDIIDQLPRHPNPGFQRDPGST